MSRESSVWLCELQKGFLTYPGKYFMFRVLLFLTSNSNNFTII